MKRVVHGILATLLIVGSASAKTYTDKTFLMPRSHNDDLAMEYATWHKQVTNMDEDKFGGTIQATGFYQKSNNKSDLGKYFGVTHWGNGDAINDYIQVIPGNAQDSRTHLYSQDVFHNYNYGSLTLTLNETLKWKPYQESYGVKLDYHQKLDKILNGLFFKVNLPIVHVKNSLGYTTTGQAANQYITSSGAFSSTSKSFINYLTGNVSNSDTRDKQVALTKAKIHNGNSTTGIADIDFMLGYNFLYKETKHINANIVLTIPTGNTADGEYVWEAIAGNGGHWGLGGGLDSAFEIWKDEDKSLDILFAFNYKYLFKSTEKRTLGYLKPYSSTAANIGKRALYGRYVLGGKRGDAFVTPLANFLTTDVNVTPGSMFDGLIDLTFNWGNWTFDFGYNLFAKASESVSVKSWDDSTYGEAQWDWNCTAENFLATTASIFGATTADTINKSDLVTDGCTSPSQVTHKLFGGIGHTFNDWKYPFMMGIGGAYEFATDNDSLEQWGLWLKFGLTF